MKLRLSEKKLEQPSPHLIQLQDEMADLKVQHRLAIQQVTTTPLQPPRNVPVLNPSL